MRKILFCLILALVSTLFSSAQSKTLDSLRKAKDSTLRALIHEDSMKVEKQFAEQERWKSLKAKIQYPVLKADEFSGFVPVSNADEIPDPTIDYKLLFELTYNNPDSMSKEINGGLNEIIRVINLHVASGIPLKKIIPVIVVHGMALDAISNNAAYQKKYKIDNPNIQTINELVKKTGVKLIACGQAMAGLDVKKEDLLPDVKISITAQTVLSHYQLKNYVLYKINEAR
jgi:intracellular sulfur oxidation DsrE/DsrF family protein